MSRSLSRSQLSVSWRRLHSSYWIFIDSTRFSGAIGELLNHGVWRIKSRFWNAGSWSLRRLRSDAIALWFSVNFFACKSNSRSLVSTDSLFAWSSSRSRSICSCRSVRWSSSAERCSAFWRSDSNSSYNSICLRALNSFCSSWRQRFSKAARSRRAIISCFSLSSSRVRAPISKSSSSRDFWWYGREICSRETVIPQRLSVSVCFWRNPRNDCANKSGFPHWFSSRLNISFWINPLRVLISSFERSPCKWDPSSFSPRSRWIFSWFSSCSHRARSRSFWGSDSFLVFWRSTFAFANSCEICSSWTVRSSEFLTKMKSFSSCFWRRFWSEIWAIRWRFAVRSSTSCSSWMRIDFCCSPNWFRSDSNRDSSAIRYDSHCWRASSICGRFTLIFPRSASRSSNRSCMSRIRFSSFRHAWYWRRSPFTLSKARCQTLWKSISTPYSAVKIWSKNSFTSSAWSLSSRSVLTRILWNTCFRLGESSL